MEKTLFQEALNQQTGEDEAGRLTAAFCELAKSPELNLLDRYESRLSRIHQRSLHNLLILRGFDVADDPEAVDENRTGQTNLFPANPLVA